MGAQQSSEQQGAPVKEEKKEIPIEDKVFDFEGDLVKQFDNNDVPVKKKKCCKYMPDAQPVQGTVNITTLLSKLGPKFKFYMVMGSIMAAAQGVVFPGFSIVFGELFNIFFSQTADEIRNSSQIIAGVFVALAVYNLATGYLGQMFWGLVGEAVGEYYRKEFFESVLRQEVGYYDQNTTGSLTAMLNTNIEHMRQGTGSKVGYWFVFASQALCGVIVAFVYSWKLTLVLIAISPLMGIGSVLQMKILARGSQSQAGAFQKATSLAIEVIGGYPTVSSFNWEDHARERYFGFMDETVKPRKTGVHLAALAWGASFFFMFAVYALGFWYGAQLVADGLPPPNSTVPAGTVMPGGIAVGDMLIVFFSIIMGAMGLGQMFSVNPEFANCRASAYQVIKLIERESLVNPNLENGLKDVQVDGNITFRNARFFFPSRPTDEVIKGLNLHIPAGTVVGVVGHSGAGKSTLIALMERFHDVTSGAILLDGVDLKDYNLHFLRENVGLVAQEPTLFDMSIVENIKLGNPNATLEQVIEAAKMANAHRFIENLPNGYETVCGEGGSLLSGGQKQRVAIARAVLKDPKILLLDEATSALDAESENLVQEALSKLMKGRTTIVVAHRLSTIRDSDLIVVMDKGVIVEQGKHMELLLNRSHYYQLISRQMDEEDMKVLNNVAEVMHRTHTNLNDYVEK